MNIVSQVQQQNSLSPPGFTSYQEVADSIWLGVVPSGIHSQVQEAESIPAVPVATLGWLLLLSCSVLILVLDMFPQFLHAKQQGKKKSKLFRQLLRGVGITESKM